MKTKDEVLNKLTGGICYDFMRSTVLKAMQEYADWQTKERDELLTSICQTNTALANRLKMYADKYGEII